MNRIAILAALFGACTNTNWHAEQSCTVQTPSAAITTTCEDACIDVTPASESHGSLCTSTAYVQSGAAGGGADQQCNSITTSDGTTGCCEFDQQASWRFYECD